MSKKVRLLVCLMYFLVFMSYVFASEQTVSIQIMSASDTIQDIRYQRGTVPDKPWNRAPLSGAPLELQDFASDTEFLFVQQSESEGNWSELYSYQYDKQSKSWSLAAFPPKGLVRFRIKPTEEANQIIRYQYGTIPNTYWKMADSSDSLTIEEFDSGKEFLFIQQMDDTKEWSDTYTYQYDYLKESWSLVIPVRESKRVSNTSLDVKAYGLLPTGCSSDSYSYLLGGGIQANISLGKWLGYTGLTYSKGPPKSAWVQSQQAVALAIGMGYSIPLSERFELIPEVGYGVIFHLLEADFDKDGTYNFEFFVDQQVRLALYLTYALNERNKLFIAPLGVFFFEKEDFGIMYGCQAGLRVSL